MNRLFAKKSLNQKLQIAKNKSQSLEEKYELGLNTLDKIRIERDTLVEQIKAELENHEILLERIKFINDSVKEQLKVKSKNQKNLTALKLKSRSIEKKIKNVENVFEAQVSEKKSFEVDGSLNDLLKNFQDLKKNDCKPASVLLSTLVDLIELTKENEFDDFNWKVKSSFNNVRLGARIRFENLSYHKQDVQNIYSPFIKKVCSVYKKYNMNVKLDSKLVNGLISTLDIIITLNKDKISVKRNSNNLELK